jgi:hypothetical protein
MVCNLKFRIIVAYPSRNLEVVPGAAKMAISKFRKDSDSSSDSFTPPNQSRSINKIATAPPVKTVQVDNALQAVHPMSPATFGHTEEDASNRPLPIFQKRELASTNPALAEPVNSVPTLKSSESTVSPTPPQLVIFNRASSESTLDKPALGHPKSFSGVARPQSGVVRPQSVARPKLIGV